MLVDSTRLSSYYIKIYNYQSVYHKNTKVYFSRPFFYPFSNIHGTPYTMLDSKMNSSMSPATPINIQHEAYMGMWEQEPVNQHHTKFGDMIDLMEPSIGHSTGTTSPTATIHHQSRDCHFQGSQYLTPLPNLSDPYCPTDCQILDGFHCSGNAEPTFHKLSDGPSNFSENYDSFISDFPHHSQHQNNHSNQGMTTILSPNGGQCSPGCPCSGGPFSHPLSTDSSLGGLCHPPSNSSHPEYNWDDLPCDPGDYSMFLAKGDSPTTSDSISYTDIDSEMDSKSSGGSLSALTDIYHVSPPKRKVGRPPKKDKKQKRNEKKTGRLWEFIRDLLKNPEYCPSLVRWENPEEGHFRFVNSEKVAQLWGQIKGNPRMTYEKLSRAMRYYYKSHVFEPVLGRRLVYKFGYNATNWKPVNPNFATIQKLYTN